MPDDGNDGMVPDLTLDQQVQTLHEHIKNLADIVQRTSQLLNEHSSRIKRVENKTQGLSDRPATRNCPNCHKRVMTATGVCGACGTQVT
jgi:hypothetical protein